MMRKHLRLVRDLLATDGSVWMHVNDRQLADGRVLMDKVFGRANDVATVNLRKPQRQNWARHLSVDSTYILIFAKQFSRWQANRLPRTGEPDSRYVNPDNDSRGPWRRGDLTVPTARPSLRYEVVGPTGTSVMPPPGWSWCYTQQRFEELDRQGRILWREGLRPTVKRYWSELPDEPVSTVWDPADVGSWAQARRELRRILPDGPDYPFPQPERLLHRILTIATMPSDVVLEFFGNAGTAAAVAHKMNRRWIAVESAGFDLRHRLDKVIAGEDPGGITEMVGWQGGGGYDVIVSAPERDEPVPEPTVSLAEAIADGHVRVPVVVYREDRRRDLATRLADACQLRERKETEWVGKTPPLLFIVCEKRSTTRRIARILRQEHLCGEGQVAVATGERVDPSVRVVIGTAEDALDIEDIAVVASCDRLSPDDLGYLVRSPSKVREIALIAHDCYESLLGDYEQMLELRVPAPIGMASPPSVRQADERPAFIRFPVGKRIAPEDTFSLSQITDDMAFNAGSTVHPGFSVPLLSQAVVAVRDHNGDVVTHIEPRDNGEAVERSLSVSEVCGAIEERVIDLVGASPTAVNAAKRIAGQFMCGVSHTAKHEHWSERDLGRALRVVTQLVKKACDSRRPGSRWELRGVDLSPLGQPDEPAHSKWVKKFVKGQWYSGWAKLIGFAVRFDAGETEGRLARLLDDAASELHWLRLDGRTVYIELEDGAKYVPDFVVVDSDGVHWVVETKADREADRPDVLARRHAADEWATAVRDHGGFGVWRYLFVPEEVIKRVLTWEDLLAHTQRQTWS
jgi:hypothetical protein